MPMLGREDEIFPECLLDQDESVGAEADQSRWAVVYTISRREKALMRKLRAHQISFYCPIVAKRNKSPSGRVRTSYLPLFSNYIFVFADKDQRLCTLETNCVSRWLDVPDGAELKRDLRQIRDLIQTGATICPESHLESGTMVRVCNGVLQGQRGVVVRHQGVARLIVAVNFLQRGASVLLENSDVEPLQQS
jgi:transcription antitermination factor NusG